VALSSEPVDSCKEQQHIKDCLASLGADIIIKNIIINKPVKINAHLAVNTGCWN